MSSVTTPAAASTLPPPRDKSHSEPRGDEAGEAPTARGSPPPSTRSPLPGGRWLKSGSTLCLSLSRHGSKQSPLSHSHDSTCLELSLVPPRIPHASAHSPHRQPGQRHKEKPPWQDGSSPSQPSSSPAGPSGQCYSRLRFAHPPQVSHVKNPCRVTDLGGDHAISGQTSACLLLRKDTASYLQTKRQCKLAGVFASQCHVLGRKEQKLRSGQGSTIMLDRCKRVRTERPWGASPCPPMRSCISLTWTYTHVPTCSKPSPHVTLCLSPLGPGTGLVCVCTYLSIQNQAS